MILPTIFRYLADLTLFAGGMACGRGEFALSGICVALAAASLFIARDLERQARIRKP
jgi:hypothetical protein